MSANVMTEDEARKKWCPEAPEVDNNRCIGSGCMAWRWTNGNPTAGVGRGFCGRAGRA